MSPQLSSSLGCAYGLVHQAKCDPAVALVLGRDLRPKAGELGVCRTALTNDRSVPTGVVVDVNDAKRSTGVQTSLDLSVVRGPIVGVERATKVVVEEVLPSDRNAEGVQAVVFDKVLHLVETDLAGVDDTAGLAGSIDGAAEVESGDLHNAVGQLSSWGYVHGLLTLTPPYWTRPEPEPPVGLLPPVREVVVVEGRVVVVGLLPPPGKHWL